jgi:protein O-mannosyl-transferase
VTAVAEDKTDSLSKPSLPTWVCAAAIAAVVLLAYSNSFQGPFIFDDREITTNLYIRHLLPPWDALFAKENVDRPLIGLSFAINYAISGLNVWSYHALNLVIHLLAALTLFGIVRRTLNSQKLRENLGRHSTVLALVTALVWIAHPLCTQAVTYIVQRCESMMGLFYLLTLYCSIRGFEAVGKGKWFALAVTSCAAGMLSKQVMITAPITILVYDYLFNSGSLKQALRRNRWLYAGLSATWVILAVTTSLAPLNRTAGFAVTSFTPLEYFKTEFGVVVHYLRLSLWPEPLVLDYRWPKATSVGDILPFAVVEVALFGATCWGLIRRKPISFTGAWFFLTLALTSSFMPFDDAAFEHRMYLPLAGVVSFVVMGAYAFCRRIITRSAGTADGARLGRLIATAVVAVVLASSVFATLNRNIAYQSDMVMWSDVVRKRPLNDRAHNNLAFALADRGKHEEALSQLLIACELNPTNAATQASLGLALFLHGETAEAKAHLLESVRLEPDISVAHYSLGRVLAFEGNSGEAIAHFSRAIELSPDHPESYLMRASAYAQERRPADALSDYRAALRQRPDWPEALGRLALGLATCDDAALRNVGEGVRLAEQAVAMTGGADPIELDILAAVYSEAGRFGDAAEVERRAVAAAAEDPELAGVFRSRMGQYQKSEKPHRSDRLSGGAPAGVKSRG